MKYYEQELIDHDNVVTDESDELQPKKAKAEVPKDATLQDEKIRPKKNL